jgi:hypothetical protein
MSKRALSEYTTSRHKRSKYFSPLSPHTGTFQTVSSVDGNSDSGQVVDNQKQLAQVIQKLCMKKNINNAFNILKRLKFQKYDLLETVDLLEYTFHKGLMHPATLINILRRLNNLRKTGYIYLH